MNGHITEFDWVQKSRLLQTCLMAEKYGYNAITAMDNYCTVGFGVQASEYKYHYIFEAPYSILLRGCGDLVKPASGCDYVILNWLVCIMCEFMWSGIAFVKLVGGLSPSSIVARFNPLHEIPIYAGCRKLAESVGIEYTPSGLPQYG